MSILIFCPFINLLLRFKSSLYMGISPLSCILQIFSPTLYFHISTGFFIEHKCFKLLNSNFFFYWNALLVLYLKIIAKPKASKFSLMLPSRSFKILLFTLMSVIRLELIFVKGIWSVSRLIFLHLFQYLLLKTILSPLSCLCQRSVDYICVGLFWALFCSTHLFLYSFSINCTVLISVAL